MMTFRNLFSGSRVIDTERALKSPHIDKPGEDNGSSASSGDEGDYAASLSKLKNLLDRPSEDIFIELEEPHKVHGPGDIVRGQVILTLYKPTKTLYTALTFRGRVSVGIGKQVVKTVLFQDQIILWGQKARVDSKKMVDTEVAGSAEQITEERPPDSSSILANAEIPRGDSLEPTKAAAWEAGCMEPGRHVFDFEFRFPVDNLPSSVDFGRGSINYSLRCDHQKPRGLRSRGRSSTRKDLTVLDTIEVGNLPIPKLRHIDPDAKHKRKEGAGKIQALVELNKAGFLKGDSIALNIQVQHVKPIKNMRGTIATLYRLSRFNSHDVAPQSFRKDLCQTVSPLLVDPRSLSYKMSTRLRIPADIFPTIKSAGPVSFRYFVEVVLDLNGRTTVWQGGTASGNMDPVSNYSIETGGEAMETEALKRDKGAHCVVFEVIIGTRDTVITRDRPRTTSARYRPPSAYEMRTGRTTSEDPRIDSDRGSSSDQQDTSEYLNMPARLPDVWGRTPLQIPQTKADLQRLENALAPSLPPTMPDESPLHLIPTAPSLESFSPLPLVPLQMPHEGAPPERKEEEVLRERASAPLDDEDLMTGSAPSLGQLGEEDCVVRHSLDLPVYRGRGDIASASR